MTATRMRPRFLPPGAPPPARALAVDCARDDCAALYSHWPGHPAPEAIIADTSTAILLRASLDPERWLTGFDHCVNDHIDVDGLLAICLACRPELGLLQGPLLVGAAAFGDFNSWPGPAAAQLALTLQGRIAAAEAAGGAWQQALLDQVVDDLEAIIAASEQPDPARDAQIDQILQMRNGFMGEAANHPLRLDQRQGYTLISGAWQHGHHGCGPTTVHQPDDCPPWAIDGFLPEDHHRLLSLADEAGQRWCLEAPPHSWAHTVRLPQVAWPDCTSVAAELAAADSAPGRWLHGPALREIGFTWLLAKVDDAGGLVPSAVPAERILALVDGLCAGR